MEQFKKKLSPKKESKKISDPNEGFSNIYDPGGFLDSVDEDISLFDGGLVLGVLGVWSGGDDDPPDFVDLTVQPPVGDELGKLPVDVVFCDTESVGDVGELEAAVGFQQLSKSLDLQLTDVESVVGVPVSVCFGDLFHPSQMSEEI